jgi:hypothetical protein
MNEWQIDTNQPPLKRQGDVPAGGVAAADEAKDRRGAGRAARARSRCGGTFPSFANP